VKTSIEALLSSDFSECRFGSEADVSRYPAPGQLWADCVEKVENAASAEFAQKRADRLLRLAMPSQRMWEGR
jgi:hypothetical protein